MFGRVLWFDVRKGFGFIDGGIKSPDGNNVDVFVHYSKIIGPNGEFKELKEGDYVEFELFFADRTGGNTKPQAKNVRLLEQPRSTPGDVDFDQRRQFN